MMSKKEKVTFSHGENFESVEDLLTSAMEKLDEANSRILRLLESDSKEMPAIGAAAEDAGAEAAAQSATVEEPAPSTEAG